MWGDEDTEHCIPLTVANSEADRIEKFAQVSNTMLIFPGSAGTLQEATTSINTGMKDMSASADKINETGEALSEITNLMKNAIDEIGEQVDQFEV